MKNKEKIKELSKDIKDLFYLCSLLQKNGFKCELYNFNGYIIKFKTFIFDNINVICSKNIADNNAEKINDYFCFETL